MFLFNLSIVEFMALFGAASAMVVTLYLLNRARRRQTVATLRFWQSSDKPIAVQRRRKIQQPISLLLQLVSIALLLLAIAQLRLGSPDRSSRDHVLILDTSAWMAARGQKGTLLDEAKTSAKAYVRALPSTDRVMVVRADALATPVTSLHDDRGATLRAIDSSRPGASALNLDQALTFADEVERLNAQRPGEIVFAGAGRVSESDGALQRVPERAIRVLPVSSAMENCGIRRIGVRRSGSDPGVWEAFVAVHNYGQSTRAVPVSLVYGNAPVGSRTIAVGAGKDEQAVFTFSTKSAGWLEARLLVEDALAEDNRAIIELPSQAPLKVAVFSNDLTAFRALVGANPQVMASYHPTDEYKSTTDATVVIFDHFRPAQLPKANVVWIDPPPDAGIAQVKTSVRGVPVRRWKPDHVLATGLRSKPIRLEDTRVYDLGQGDVAIAEVDAGPVIVARSGEHRQVILGFRPSGSLRYDLSTPLLFANILRWMEPDVFRNWEVYAGTAGVITSTVDSDAEAAGVKVTSDGKALPTSVKGRKVRFFAGLPGTVQLTTEAREQVYSLTLPDVGDVTWAPPSKALNGIPPPRAAVLSRDTWPLLAILGALGLLTEWLLYGRARQAASRRGTTAPASLWRKAS